MNKKIVSGIMLVLLIFSLIGVHIIGVTAQETHDIAVVYGTLSQISVRLGELVNITVVVENQGTENETFDVTIYYDNIEIETKTVLNLAAGLNTSLAFIWDTASVSEDIYASPAHRKTSTLKTVASIVPGETETEDNTFWYHEVYVFAPHYLRVIPESTVDPSLTPGKNYTVSIYTDYNGSDIWGWQFGLTYNPLVLQGVSVTNGDLITTAKDSSAMFYRGTFNNTSGRLSLTLALFFYMAPAEPYVTSGPGILANITFTVVGTGDSDITLVKSETELTGYKDGQTYEIVSDWKPYIRHIISGYFKNTEEIVTHDVAVVDVTFSPTSVKQGEPVNITVVVENQGTVAETFSVAAYYSYIHPNYLVATAKTVQTLEAGANISLAFVWDTEETYLGTHFILAEASTVPGETDTEDNTFQGDELVTILPAHVLPVASFTYSPSQPKINDTITFDASPSYDPDGTIIGYSWAFGDGMGANDTGPITTHAYADAGNYTVTLYVYDDDYQPDSYTLNVTVTHQQVPVEATQELIETIETWNLPKGTENSLKAKLKVAIHMLDMGKEDGAIRKLTAFINRAEMLREKTLTNEQADELVSEAQRIIDLING